MKNKVSARTYELLVNEMQDALYDFVTLGAPTYEPHVRKFAAETVDMIIDLVYTGEKIDKHMKEMLPHLQYGKVFSLGEQ